MTTRAGRVLQDQNLNVHLNEGSVGWETNISKAPKKGGLGGRTPLGDLSNSLKPFLNQTSKKQISTAFLPIPFTEKQTGTSKIELDASKKKSTTKSSGKVQGGGRKPLSDISNSGKPHANEESNKSYDEKLSVVAEEPIDTNAIAEERFLHNHEECIKAQTRSLDLDEFLKIIGLDNDFPKQSKTHEMPVKEAESPPRLLELEEMKEPIIEDKSCKYKLFGDLDSPLPCSSPTLSKGSFCWDDDLYDIDFELIESP